MAFALILIGMGYLIGSLSSAIIVCKILNLPDPRVAGSHNPGATNVLRLGGKLPAAITLLGDLLKGLLPVILARLLGAGSLVAGMVALAAFVGHLFPIFFSFKGGKGMATSAGAWIGLSPFLGVVAGLAWIVIATITRYSSVASLAVAALMPFVILLFGPAGGFLPVLLMSLILIWRHSANIQRLRSHTESKINL